MFGLTVASELQLPEAREFDGGGEPDVTIRVQEIDASPTSPGICSVGRSLLLTVPDVGRYLIREGCEIQVDPYPTAPERNVRLYLLGSALGALLHQRALLPLHANAVEIDGRAFAFVGQSGAGKSTLAGVFHDLGHPVIADDVCVISGIASGSPVVEPALRRLRLWRDALIASGRDPHDFEPSYSGDPSFDKFDVPLSPVENTEPVLLRSIILLEFGDEECLKPVGGVEAAEILFAHTYRGGIVDYSGTAHLHWEAVIRLLSAVRILRWIRPRRRSAIEASVRRLIAALRGLDVSCSDELLRNQVR
jgi:hypothetical protein